MFADQAVAEHVTIPDLYRLDNVWAAVASRRRQQYGNATRQLDASSAGRSYSDHGH
jgi:hypothetical protein